MDSAQFDSKGLSLDIDFEDAWQYNPNKSPEENYGEWLNLMYDTFMGIFDGSISDIVDEYANEKETIIKTDFNEFTIVNGLDDSLLSLLRTKAEDIDDLLLPAYRLKVKSSLKSFNNQPSKLDMFIRADNSLGLVMHIQKSGEDFDEPVDIFIGETYASTISQEKLASLLGSLLPEQVVIPDSYALLTHQQKDKALEALVYNIGDSFGLVKQENKVYTPLEDESNESVIVDAGIATNYIELPDQTVSQITIVRHEIYPDLDGEVIYRLIAETSTTPQTPDGNVGSSQVAHKTVAAPANFCIKNLSFEIQKSDGITEQIPLDEQQIHLMTKTVQSAIANLSY
jgi:hypothetical protein